MITENGGKSMGSRGTILALLEKLLRSALYPCLMGMWLAAVLTPSVVVHRAGSAVSPVYVRLCICVSLSVCPGNYF